MLRGSGIYLAKQPHGLIVGLAARMFAELATADRVGGRDTAEHEETDLGITWCVAVVVQGGQLGG